MVGVKVFDSVVEKRWARLCMAVGKLLPMFTAGIVLNICMQHTDEANQHKVLKHKQQHCYSKYLSKNTRIFPKVYSSCQNIGNRHSFLVGGGRQIFTPPPPFQKIL